MDDVENELLRAHVTRVGFDLTLGKTHIAALVYLNETIRQRTYFPWPGEGTVYRTAFTHFASCARGLGERGLVIHKYREEKKHQGIYWHYKITKAGKLVVELLKEAGIYQEYLVALTPVTREPVAREEAS